MSTDHDQIARAKAVLAARDNGDYDDALGITPEQRDVLNRVRGEGRLTLDDFRTLMELGEHELAVQAHNDDRIDLDQEK